MREDMGKVITERPRSKSRLSTEKFGKSIAWHGWDEDYAEPRRASGSKGRTYGWEGKEFTDVLGPLEGWLRKQVGRPWDKVYSEVCQVLDKRKLTHKHVLDHLFNWVARTVILCPDGIWREPEMVGYRWSRPPAFYVHPKSGLLVENRKSKETEKAEPVRKLKVNEFQEYRKENDVWYLFTRKEAPQADWHYDPLTGKTTKPMIEEKRQLGKKDLRELRKKLDA